MNARFRPLLLIVTVFWIYVALSDVLYANQMQSSLTAMHVGHVFAPWRARLLQHRFGGTGALALAMRCGPSCTDRKLPTPCPVP